MKIALERLSDSPTSFDAEGDAAWWRSLGTRGARLPAELPEPLRFHVRAHRMGEDVYLEGRVEGWIPLECSRCLARYRHALSEPFRLVLEPAGSRLPADPEGAEALRRDGLCLGDEIETGWFQGPEIDLARFLREVVALALPVQPLCREDCAGLCPRCGADRNRVTCECRESEKASPFAVLAKLRRELPEGES